MPVLEKTASLFDLDLDHLITGLRVIAVFFLSILGFLLSGTLCFPARGGQGTKNPTDRHGAIQYDEHITNDKTNADSCTAVRAYMHRQQCKHSQTRATEIELSDCRSAMG